METNKEYKVIDKATGEEKTFSSKSQAKKHYRDLRNKNNMPKRKVAQMKFMETMMKMREYAQKEQEVYRAKQKETNPEAYKRWEDHKKAKEEARKTQITYYVKHDTDCHRFLNPKDFKREYQSLVKHLVPVKTKDGKLPEKSKNPIYKYEEVETWKVEQPKENKE